MKIPFLDLKQVNAPYMDALKDAASAVVESGWHLLLSLNIYHF